MGEIRTDQLIKIRPIIPQAKIKEGISTAENFQNQTLRPIIKFQHDLLILVFKNYLNKRKLTPNSSQEKLIAILDKAFLNDNQFKNKIYGIVVGHFTTEEYEWYTTQTSEINKRISQIIKERLTNNIENIGA